MQSSILPAAVDSLCPSQLYTAYFVRGSVSVFLCAGCVFLGGWFPKCPSELRPIVMHNHIATSLNGSVYMRVDVLILPVKCI